MVIITAAVVVSSHGRMNQSLNLAILIVDNK
jgi:hypothetical protein